MKKIFILTATAFLLCNAQAQIKIDRSKKPEAGPAPVINIKDAQIYKMSNGITVLVVEDHKLPRVSASLFIDAGPITEGTKAGAMEMMGQMLNEGTTDMPKAEFDEAVDKIGSEVSLSYSGGSASALTRYFKQAFILMGKGLKNPAFSAESFDKVKSQLLTAMKSDEKNVKAVSSRVVDALTFGKNHPKGEFKTRESVQALTLNDIKAFYGKYITPSRSYLTFIGDIKPEAARQLAEEVFADWKGASLSLPVLAKVANPEKTEINVIDMPNAVQSEITVTNLVDLKMNNPDYFAVLLANQILGGGAESRLFNNLREKHGFTYGAYSSTKADRFQGTFSASASVRTAKTDSAVVEFLNEIEKLRNEKVSDQELRDARALFNGSFALGLENPSRTASFARNILINDLPKDFYKTYLRKINEVTAEDIQRVVQKYFNRSNTRVVIVGNASQMLAGLQKLNYPVKMFDPFANAVKSSPASASNVSVGASDVLNNYLKAISGIEELKKVKSIFATAKMEMQGMSIDIQNKSMVPNMELTSMSMGGNEVMRKVFNGSTGYEQQMGNKKEMTAEEIAEKKIVSSLFEQMDYLNNPSIKKEVKGVEKINGSDAYKLLITLPSGKTRTEYYDVNSKYLVKVEESATEGEMSVMTTEEYSDYQKAGNIMFPFTHNVTVSANGQQQAFEMKVKEVKINEGVSAADFK